MLLRKILAYNLQWIAKRLLSKYRPKIVAVTGSVGKSTTKEAIFWCLNKHFKVRRNIGNLNTEIGVPLTIIGGDYVGGNLWKWLEIKWQGLRLLWTKGEFPEILVLEMAADRPGDLQRLTSYIKPDVGVITNIGISHLEFFKTKEALRQEKAAIIREAKELAVLNADNKDSMTVRDQTKAKVVTFGLSSADFTPSTVNLESGLPEPTIYAKLAAVAVAKFFGISPDQAALDLKDFQNLPGRLEVFPGISGSTIIDDSYNSAPDSAMSALGELKNRPGRKIAVFGRMSELGSETERGHRQVGKMAAQIGLDLLLVRNNEAKMIGEEAVASGLLISKVKEFDDAAEAAEILKHEIRSGDVVLVKGSHSEHLEDVVRAIVA